MEVSDDFSQTKYVGNNIEAGNYYTKSTFIMTRIKQEKLVFILGTFGSIYAFLQNYLQVRRYPKILISGIRFLEITENAQP